MARYSSCGVVLVTWKFENNGKVPRKLVFARLMNTFITLSSYISRRGGTENQRCGAWSGVGVSIPVVVADLCRHAFIKAMADFMLPDHPTSSASLNLGTVL